MYSHNDSLARYTVLKLVLGFASRSESGSQCVYRGVSRIVRFFFGVCMLWCVFRSSYTRTCMSVMVLNLAGLFHTMLTNLTIR